MAEDRVLNIELHLRSIEAYRRAALAGGDDRRVARAEQLIVQLEQQLAAMATELDRQGEAERERRDPGRQAERQHVFVVNGDPDFLNMMRSLLQDERFNVTTANFVPATFDVIAALRPALILVHLAIGVQAGWDVLTRMQEEAVSHDIPVVATAHEWVTLARAQADQARRGTARFRAVPLDLGRIMGAIDDLIGKA